MKPIHRALIAALAAGALAPVAAHAQFMDMFKQAMSNAAVNAAADKVGDIIRNPGSVTSKVGGSNEAPAGADAAAPLAAAPAPVAKAAPGCPKSRATALPSVGTRPADFKPEILWPAESSCPAYAFSDFKFDAAKEQRQKFVDASAVSCSDCEGGKDYEAWANHYVTSGDSKKFEEKLLALKTGEHVTWKGKKFSGDIVLTGSAPVGGFPCKQFHWTLKDNKSGAVAAEREGMYCEYKGEYSASASWHEVI